MMALYLMIAMILLVIVLIQTGKYVVHAEDLPRASKLPCSQRPIKRVEFESILEK